MKQPFFFIVIIVLSFSAYSQSNPPITAYFDKYWVKITDPHNATFYRTVEKVDGKFLSKDYYMSGQLQMAVLCDAVTPKLMWEGKATLFHENGVVQEEGPFKNEDRFGLHKFWYKDGSKHKEVFYKDKKQVYHNYWSASGEPLLVNGNGVIQEAQTEALPACVMEIKDSIVIASFTIDANTHDTIYSILDKMPEYKGGYEALNADLKATMKYPREARRAGIEGIVYVHFIVDKDGKATDLKVLRGISEACDAEAMRAVGTLNNWNQGMHQGKPVQFRFVLPVKFTLKGRSLF